MWVPEYAVSQFCREHSYIEDFLGILLELSGIEMFRFE